MQQWSHPLSSLAVACKRFNHLLSIARSSRRTSPTPISAHRRTATFDSMCNLNIRRYTGCGCIDSDPIPCSFASSPNEIHNCELVYVRNEAQRNGRSIRGKAIEGICHLCQTGNQNDEEPSRTETPSDSLFKSFFFWHIPLAAQNRFLDKFSIVNFNMRTIHLPWTPNIDPETGKTTFVKGDGYPYRVVEMAHLCWPMEHMEAMRNGKIRRVLSEQNDRLCYQEAETVRPIPFPVYPL